MRNYKFALAALAWGILMLAATAQPPPQSAPKIMTAPGKSEGREGSHRVREGTKLTDVVGSFQLTGDRYTFFPAESKDESFRVLENLALERIARVLGESRTEKKWVINGVITEFKEANHILITKAMIQLAPEDQ